MFGYPDETLSLVFDILRQEFSDGQPGDIKMQGLKKVMNSWFPFGQAPLKLFLTWASLNLIFFYLVRGGLQLPGPLSIENMIVKSNLPWKKIYL